MILLNQGSLKEIEEFCKNNMPKYMRPKKIRVISAQNINSSGKGTRIFPKD